MMGSCSFLYCYKRFLSVSMLSSERPEIALRAITRSISASSSTTKWRTPARWIVSAMTSFQPVLLSRLRGKPSTRYFPAPQPFLTIASLISPQVMATGTILPSSMILWISSPCSEPLALSARRRSPADKWM